MATKSSIKFIAWAVRKIVLWWRWLESNQRYPGYELGALTAVLHRRISIIANIFG